MGELANLFQQDIFNELGQLSITFSLILMRIIGFVNMAPVFSHKSVTSMSRMGMAIFLSLILADVIVVEVPEEGYSMLYAIIMNVALGMLIGFTARLMFSTVTAGGEMMDSSMGFSSGQIFDPSSGSQTTIIGKFFGVLSIVVFFMVQGPHLLIKGLANSFNSFGLYDFNLMIDINKMIFLTGDIIRMGFLIVSPIVLTILVADLVLGLVSRAAPQINAFQISFTIKPSIGAIVLLLTLPLFFESLRSLFTSPSRLF